MRSLPPACVLKQAMTNARTVDIPSPPPPPPCMVCGTLLPSQAQWPAPGGSGSAVVGGRCAALSPAQAVMAVWAMAAVGLYQRQLFDGTGGGVEVL